MRAGDGARIGGHAYPYIARTRICDPLRRAASSASCSVFNARARASGWPCRQTTVRVFNVNTKSRIEVTVLTPGRRVTYDGLTSIDGVAGTAAPIRFRASPSRSATTPAWYPTVVCLS